MEKTDPVLELEIYLIRHAQSEGNIKRKNPELLTVADHADPKLTELGIEQAKRLGNYLAPIPFDAVYSSALLRAVRTATELINKQSGRQPLRLLPLLTENGMGEEYKGAEWKDIHAINPDAALAADLSPDTPLMCYSNSADDDALLKRAKQTIDYLRSHHNHGEKIAVVSHAAFITTILFYLFGMTKSPAFDINCENTGITRILFYKPGTNKYGDLVFDYINDTAHLK